MKPLHLLIGSGALVLSAAIISTPGALKIWTDSKKASSEQPFVIRASGVWGNDVEVKWELLKTDVIKPAGTRFQPSANVVHLKAIVSNLGKGSVRIQKLVCVGMCQGFDVFSVPVFAEAAESPLILKPGTQVTLTATGDVAEGLIRNPERVDNLIAALACVPEGAPVEDSYHQKLLSGEKATQ